VPLNLIQRQLGYTNLGTTTIYLQGIDPEEIIKAVRTRRPADDVGERRAAALNESEGDRRRERPERSRFGPGPGGCRRLPTCLRRSCVVG
jgi:hypothetical protein